MSRAKAGAHEPEAEMPAAELLDTSPFGDEPEAEPEARPARRGMSKVTLALGAGVVLMAGVLIGIQAQKAWGTASPSGAASMAGNGAARGLAGGFGGGTGRGFGGGMPGGFPGGGQGSQRGQGPQGQGGQDQPGRAGASGGMTGGMTVGTVKLVDGAKVYVQTAGGTIVTVRTSGDTKVQVTKAGKLADLKVGGQVVVTGPTDEEGAVDATSLVQSARNR
ncbi:hypothetical protein [Microtetraspora sp. NBRC 16547]|uniref:hypothetical protein n=1 Tax=Microtetraspora sp. NBRC 16547 TaxID=3030993 RepID=UPI0024A27EDC|nr:hypothetical protein [Microtetraspora sp. NBRC 16547]GLW97481.1 hypothetical protein Misp02_15680 [Microtetraspora sp. NBRC 16547]